MSTPQAPALSFLTTLSVSVGMPLEVGPTAEGYRRVIPITGGTATGPELNGVIDPVGADFQLLIDETTTHLEAKYVLKSDAGERIYITNWGIRTGRAEDIARLVRGEAVDPERIYFRCTPRLESPGPRWGWLAERILVGTGRRLQDRVEIDVFVLE
ncbi:DUF3237 domain-containing protein [Kocuria sp. JC486]|uniref:DUF3237 domain-containing protein n=1 Tax=Kocuria sp. JC486 TaxID=1970736 RepID=UPI001422574E|nr:DUF3237 domain-containing protein [Kocuria sp. JC486]NHU84276.1 DUF3237 domain-containing protein [Kocuria sp. JC486]